MANVKVLEKLVKLQGQGHKVKIFDTNRKKGLCHKEYTYGI
jgi:hypothetical protein